MSQVVIPTTEQMAQIAEHRELDAATAPEPYVLSAKQQSQMDYDLERLLPANYHTEKKTVAGLRKAARQGLKEASVTDAVKVSPRVGSAWKWHAFPMGGWVEWGKPAWMQRQDQGQDFEVLWGHSIVATGWGHCVSHLSDQPFPNGFGSPYMVVYIGSGRFGGRLWYLGHMNYVQIHEGESFGAGRALGRLYNSLNVGRGWIELGHAANGYPGPLGEGENWHSLFTSPEWRWAP